MKQRRVPELMDAPDIPLESHHRALAGLQTINYWSDSVGIVWRQIEPLLPLDRPLRILDVATGAGDIPIGLWQPHCKSFPAPHHDEPEWKLWFHTYSVKSRPHGDIRRFPHGIGGAHRSYAIHTHHP